MSRTLLPDHGDARAKVLGYFHALAGSPEDVNPFYLGEIIDTLLTELWLAESQRDLLRALEEAVGGEG